MRAVNEGIRLADISGDLSAESTNGSIILDRIDSANVDLYTVNGNISYDGPLKDKGLYRLTTHNGMIAIPIAERSNVTLSARTYNGSIRSTFPLPTEASSERRTKRLNLTLGNGSAHVELESFGGTIALRRPGEPRPETERRRRERGDRDRDAHDHPLDHGGADVAAAIADAEAHIPDALAVAQARIPAAIAEANAVLPDAIAEAQRALPEALAAAQASIPEALEAARAAMPEAVAAAQAAIPEAMAEAAASLPDALDEALSALPAAIDEALRALHPAPRPEPRPR